MKTIKLSRKSGGTRSQRGQAIIGGTAMMILMTFLGMGVVMILLYWAILATDFQRISGIADEAARQAVSLRYNLGSEKPEFMAQENIIPLERTLLPQCLTTELSALGYSLASPPRVTYSQDVDPNNLPTTNGLNPNVAASNQGEYDGLQPQVPYAGATVDFDVVPNGLDVFGIKGFLLIFRPHFQGFSSNTETGIRRHGMATILFVDQSDPKHVTTAGIRVPVYNYTRVYNQLSSPIEPLVTEQPVAMASRPNMFKPGSTIGKYPVGQLTITCDSVQGYFKRDKSGVPGGGAPNGYEDGMN